MTVIAHRLEIALVPEGSTLSNGDDVIHTLSWSPTSWCLAQWEFGPDPLTQLLPSICGIQICSGSEHFEMILTILAALGDLDSGHEVGGGRFLVVEGTKNDKRRRNG